MGGRLSAAVALLLGVIFLSAAPAPALSTPTITSTASGSTTVGLQIFDNVNLSGGSNPTGTLTFNLFGPDNATCSGAAAFTTTRAVSGDGSYNSAPFTTTQAGTYRWVVSYSGDANNNPVGPTSCSDPSESVIVSPFMAALTTTASAGVPVGGAIHDTAHLNGLNPTGTITFRLSGPTDTFCGMAPVFMATVPVTAGSGDYNSPDFMPAAPGTYKWQASYSGDTNNQAVPITACLDPNEAVTITAGKASPTITTTASGSVTVGGLVTDQATIAGGNSPTGTITFNLFGPADATCSAMPAFTSMVPVSGNAAYASGSFTTTSVGTFHWTAAYSGDTNNNPASSGCGAANESVTVTMATPTLSTTASAAIALGGSLHDTATLSGGFSPTGTITFALFGPDNAMCSGAAAFTSTVTVAGAGSYTSGSFTPTAAGTYRWVATYSGDANDNPAGPTTCADAAESVVVSPASTTTTSSSTTTTSTTMPTTTSSTAASTTTSTMPTTTTSTSTTTTSTTLPASTTTTSMPTTTSTSTSTTSTSSTVPTTTSTTTSTSTTSTSTTVPQTTTTSSPSTTSTTVSRTTSTSSATTSSTAPSTTSTTTTTSPSTTTTTTTLPSATTTTTTVGGPSVQANPSTVPAGQSTVISGSGFPSATQLTVTMFSDPVVLATPTTSATGTFQVTVTIPASTTPGTHTLVVAPVRGAQATTTITVTAAVATSATTATTVLPGLSLTGARAGSESWAAGLLVLLGVGLILATRRRYRPW